MNHSPVDGVSPLVGRVAESSHLLQAVEDVRRGRGRIVLVVGDAGVGKTRLAHEVSARAGLT